MEIWGHRGAYDFAPENTIKSFELAVQMGAYGVEFDIQLTKDGEIVVIHDEKIDRVTNETGYVKDYTLSELKGFNFNKRGLTTPIFMEIPTLFEVLELLCATDLQINIELKTGIVYYPDIEKKAFEKVEYFGLKDKVIWSSFNHYSIQKIKQFDTNARTALLCGNGILATAEQCKKINAEALHPDIKQVLYPELIEDCKKNGIKVRPYTINEASDIRLMYESGVDGIFTNNIPGAKNELSLDAGL